MPLRNTIIVIVLLILIGGYALFAGLGGKTIATPKLLNFKAADATKIDLKYPESEVVVQRDKDHGWELVKPISAKADKNAVKSLAQSLADCDISSTLEEKPANLAPFGLAKPRAIVSVTTKNGTLPAIDVGSKTPVGYSAYVKMANKPAVLMVAASFPPSVIKTANDLRDHTLWSFKVDDVDRVKLAQAGQPPTEIVRSGGKWKITAPADYPADPTAVQTLLTSLNGLRAANFITDHASDLSKYGLNQPSYAVTVYTGKKDQPHTLNFGADQGKYQDGVFVRVSGDPLSVATVYKQSMTGVEKTVNQLRDKTVMSFDPAQVNTLKVNTPMEDYTIKRDGKGWKIAFNGKTENARTAKVDSFLDQLRFLKGMGIAADRMTNPKQFGMNDPKIVYTLYN
ncbi:MAG: DUF4340 domain-containing protein, partial [Candidatus Binataceae bacterium]